jgi:hypothetical protein
VDNEATGNNDGSEWENAWQSFADIQWSSINPGDYIYISGGLSSKTYSEQLAIGASGSSGLPITISVGQDNGHNGEVIITHDSHGIYMSGKSYITIDGNYKGNRNIYVYNCGSDGIYVKGSNINNISLTYVEVGWNGDAKDEDGIHVEVTSYSYYPDPIIEISYCLIHDNYQDQIMALKPDHSIRATDYGAVIVHHNDIYNMNDDGFQAACGGIDFYENTVHGRVSHGSSGHADGIQFLGGDFTQIFNNEFYDSVNQNSDSNSYIFVDPYSSTSRAIANLKIYNNLIHETGTPAPNEYLRGIAFKAESGINHVSDILIANNIIVGTPAWGMTLTFNSLDSDNVNNVKVYNNILYNCYTLSGGQFMLMGSGSYTTGSEGDGADVTIDYNNVNAGNQGKTTVNFKGSIYNYNNFRSASGCQDSEQIGDPDLDENHKPNAGSPAIDNGFDLSSYYTTDRDGNPRIVPWDIGAYEYTGAECAGTDTSCGVYPNCENCNLLDGCSGNNYQDYICSGTTCIIGSSDDCSDCSCSCSGYNQEESAANGNCNDGKDNDCDGSVDIEDSGCQIQYFLPGQYIEAEHGELESPMQVASNTTASEGLFIQSTTYGEGSVNFTFDIQQAGNYKMRSRIVTPCSDIGACDSFYIGLDGESIKGNSEYTYDLLGCHSFTWDDVSLRGPGGSFDYAEYDPMIWYLSAGLHTFTFYNRENYAGMDQIILKQILSYHRADSNQDGCIQTNELLAFIDRWKISSKDVTMPEMMEAIGLWKAGTGCNP